MDKPNWETFKLFLLILFSMPVIVLMVTLVMAIFSQALKPASPPKNTEPQQRIIYVFRK